MKKTNSIIDTARQTIELESSAIANLKNFINSDFENARLLIRMQQLYDCLRQVFVWLCEKIYLASKKRQLLVFSIGYIF